MKKTWILMIALVAVFSLALGACGKKPAATTTTDGTTNSVQGGFDENTPLPESTELMVGTMKLEGTDYQVTAEQAAALLPLWKAYKTLTTSDNTAQAELDALLKQIKDGMTTEQLAEIDKMGLTQASMRDLFQQTFAGTAEAANASGTPMPEAGFQGGEGFPPGGAPPDGGGPVVGFEGGPGGAPGGFFGANGGTPDPSMISTMEARRSAAGGGLRINAGFFDLVISYLEGKTQSQ